MKNIKIQGYGLLREGAPLCVYRSSSDLCVYEHYTNHELEQYTHDLQQLLLSEGFSCRHEPDGVSTAQDIWVQMSPGPSGIIRITIRYDGWLYVDFGSDIPRVQHGVLNGPAPIKKLVAILDAIRQVLIEMPPCSTCHYYNHPRYHEDGYCGRGLAMVKGCTGYRVINNYKDRHEEE